MFDRFTNRAKRVMNLARVEAQQLKHGYLGTEHILLGLVQEGGGVAAQVLKQKMHIDLAQIRTEVEKVVETGPSTEVVGQLPFTPRAKKVLEYSMEEASLLGHNYIGTEHVLLGLIKENEGIASVALKALGVKLGDARSKVIEHLADDPERNALVRGDFVPRAAHGGSAPSPMDVQLILTSAIDILRVNGKESLALELESVARELASRPR